MRKLEDSKRNGNGSYAVTTIYRIPWGSSENNASKTKERKKKLKKVVHKLFWECSQNIIDPYWKEIFENASYNKFPRGFTYKYGVLIHRKGNKTNKAEIPQNVDEALAFTMSFFREMAGLMSKKERGQIQKDINRDLVEKYALENLTWDNINKEKVRELLINDYVYQIATELQLDQDGYLELLTLINKGFLLNFFTNKDVVFENGVVKLIKGLTIDTVNKKFWIDPQKHSKKSRSKAKSSSGSNTYHHNPKLCLIKKWNKYIESLNKSKTDSYSLTILGTPTTNSSGDDLSNEYLKSSGKLT